MVRTTSSYAAMDGMPCSAARRPDCARWDDMVASAQRLPIFSRPRDEREFLPAALEIIETPASPAGRAIGGAITLLFVLALTWAVFGRVDIVATAPGKIVP